jgi:xylan 1,4-beta-xylosidase
MKVGTRMRFHLACSLLLLSSSCAAYAAPAAETITIDTRAEGQPFPHYWEQMFGSGRAILSLREDYRRDLREVRAATDFKYVRFHAILDDEVGVYNEDAQGNPVYNWSYVDHIYDGLQENGIKPYIELSFMPKKMASRLDYHAFWYKQIVAPPADYNKWGALVHAFTQHLVDRYGVDEVSTWYFEVWNEPNIDFWTGKPAQSTYFELYDHAARAVKAVSPRLRVGGPATAQAAWVDAMIAHATSQNVPLDFVSTHVYGNDTAQDVFGRPQAIPPHGMVCEAVKHVHEQIKASAKPEMPLIWSEFNATYMNQQEITDSTYIGPWMANTIRECDGMTAMMSYWSFSDVFEEQGVVKTPFYGGYGLMAEDDIPKPSLTAFSILHKLGTTRLENASTDALVTKRPDGSLVIALWNLVEPGVAGSPKEFQLSLKGLGSPALAQIMRADADHGDTLDAWKEMGSPADPTKEQIMQLRKVGSPVAPESLPIEGGKLRVSVPSQGLAVITVRGAAGR